MNIALIVAAGSGTRMGNVDRPKQFLPVCGKPLLIHTISAFQNHKEIDAIVIVTNPDYFNPVEDWAIQYGLNKIKSIVAGGKTRQASVYNGLKAAEKLISSKDDIILIHDAARPLVSEKIISENILMCQKYGAVDTVIKSKDTIIKSKDNESINDILNRDEIYQTQTPQTFRYSIISDAHDKARLKEIPNVTDDAKIVLSMGIDVRLVEGSVNNFKVTTMDDLKLLEALLKINEDK